MRLEQRIQFIKDDPRLDRNRPGRRVQVKHTVHVTGEIQRQACSDCLPGLRGPTPTRRDRDAVLPAEPHHLHDILSASRRYHAHGDNLVDARVRRVHRTAGAVKVDFA